MEKVSNPNWQSATLSYQDKFALLREASSERQKDANQVLEGALFAFNALTEHDEASGDVRIDWAKEISLYLGASDTFDDISNKHPDLNLSAFDMPLPEYASILKRQATSQAIEFYNSFAGHNPLTTDEKFHDAYLNRRRAEGEINAELYRDHPGALSALLFEEQWSQSGIHSLTDFERTIENGFPVDTQIIDDIRVGQDLFYQAHASMLPEQKRQLLEAARTKLASAKLAISNFESEKQAIPISKAISQRMHAQSVYDLSAYIEDDEERRMCQDCAVDELTSAESAILSAIQNNTTGIQGLDIIYGKIMYFQSTYRSSLEHTADRADDAIRKIGSSTLQHAA